MGVGPDVFRGKALPVTVSGTEEGGRPNSKAALAAHRAAAPCLTPVRGEASLVITRPCRACAAARKRGHQAG